MPVLEGVAASTQLGDIGAFFLAAAVLVGLAQRPGQGALLLAPAIMVGCAAVMRTLSSSPAMLPSRLSSSCPRW